MSANLVNNTILNKDYYQKREFVNRNKMNVKKKKKKEKFYFIHAIRYEFLFKLQLRYPTPNRQHQPFVLILISFIDLFAMLSVGCRSHCFMFKFCFFFRCPFMTIQMWGTLMWEKGKLKMCNVCILTMNNTPFR